MAFEVRLSGEVYDAVDDFQLTQQARAVAQTTVTVKVGDAQDEPEEGQEVVILKGGVRVFLGVVTDVDPPEYSMGFESWVVTLSVASEEVVFNWRLVTGTWYHSTWAQILEDIYAGVIAEEFIALGGISAPATPVKRYTVTDKRLADVLSEIADAIGGAVYWISPEKEFYFRTAADLIEVAVPLELTGVKLRRSISDMRTVQKVRGASSSIRATAQDTDAIVALRAKSGLSGRIEVASSDTTVRNAGAAATAAASALGQYSEPERALSLICHDHEASQLYRVWPMDRPEIRVTGDFVVVERTMTIRCQADESVTVAVKLKNRGFFQRYGFTLRSASKAAESALATLADIASDGLFTPGEKVQKRGDWLAIEAETPSVLAQAATYSVSTTAYEAAFYALATYLNGGSSWSVGELPLWFQPDEMSMTETVDPEEFRQKWGGYAEERLLVQATVIAAGRAFTEDSLTPYILGTVSPPNVAGKDGYQYRDTVLGIEWVYQYGGWVTAENFSDGAITPREKPSYVRIWAQAEADYLNASGMVGVTGLASSTAWATYRAAYAELRALLFTTAGATPPILPDTSTISVGTQIGVVLTASKGQYDQALAILNAEILTVISNQSQAVTIDCGVYDGGVPDQVFDCGTFSQTKWDLATEQLDCGVYDGGASAEVLNCGQYDGGAPERVIDCGEFAQVDAFELPERIINCGTFDLFS